MPARKIQDASVRRVQRAAASDLLSPRSRRARLPRRSRYGFGLRPSIHRFVHHDLADVFHRRQVVHGVQQHRSRAMVRRPRAPVLRFMRLAGDGRSASGRNSSSTSSISNSFLNCLRDARSSARSGSRSAPPRPAPPSVATTGRRPTNSGIRPNLIRSSGSTSASTSLPCCPLVAASSHLGDETDAAVFFERFRMHLVQTRRTRRRR